MTRQSRAALQLQTRERLLCAAHELFRRDGYTATTVDRIAEAAGYSKGAVYSNFTGKEEVFLEVLSRQGDEKLDAVLARLADAVVASDDEPLVAALADWADDASRSGSWSLSILEHAREASPDSPSRVRQDEIIHRHWRRLGEFLLQHRPGLASDATLLGALLHEIAFAPAMTFVEHPTAGALMRLTLTSLLSRYRSSRACHDEADGTSKALRQAPTVDTVVSNTGVVG